MTPMNNADYLTRLEHADELEALKAAKKASQNDFKGISAYDIRTDSKDEIFAYQTNEVKEMYNLRWTKVKSK